MKHNGFIKSLNVCLMLLMSFGPVISYAQSNQVITLQQALQMGMETSYQLRISKSKFDYAKSKHDETYDLQYPSAKLSAGYSRLSDVPEFQIVLPGSTEPQTLFPVYLNSFQNHISLTEVIFAGFRVKTAKESADKNLEAAGYDVKKDEQDVRLNIISAYFNLYKVQQAVKIIAENKKLVDQRLKDVQNLEKNGMATRNDELRLQLQQSNTALSQIDAENILQSANYNFNLLVGLPGNVKVELDTTSIFDLKTVSDRDAFMSNALQNRPEVKALDLRNQALEDNLKVAQNGYWPTVSAGANLFYASPNQRYIPRRMCLRQRGTSV
jgi:outer membrane protein